MRNNAGCKKYRAYGIWGAMKRRCLSPIDRRFARYGGRGIKVCDRWLSFSAFLADMGECPAGMQIERNNNDGDYCPENCRWATVREQSRNKSTSTMLTLGGKTQCLAAWEEEFGVDRKTIQRRIQRFGAEEGLKRLREPMGKKLLTEHIVEIRKLYHIQKLPIRGIAERFQVTRSLISLIVRNKIWKQVS